MQSFGRPVVRGAFAPVESLHRVRVSTVRVRGPPMLALQGLLRHRLPTVRASVLPLFLSLGTTATYAQPNPAAPAQATAPLPQTVPEEPKLTLVDCLNVALQRQPT